MTPQCSCWKKPAGKSDCVRFIGSRTNATRDIRVNCRFVFEGVHRGHLQRRLGRFESARGDAIFLDEVGDLPMETPVALYEVLKERGPNVSGVASRLP
jgi:DNA-binding NtrC family response regulator